MPISFDSAVTFTGEDQTTPTSTDAWTIAATADRFALAAMLARDFGTLGTHSGMTVEGVAMTQLGSAASVEDDTTARVSRWNLFGGGEPASGSSRTLAGTLSEEDAIALIAAVVLNGVHQTTPINSTPTATVGAWDETTGPSPDPSITITTVSGGKAYGVLSVRRSDTTTPTFTPGSGVTVRAQVHAILEDLYLLEKDDTSLSTVISANLVVPSSSGTWRLDGYGIQPAAAGAAVAPLAMHLQRLMRA